MKIKLLLLIIWLISISDIYAKKVDGIIIFNNDSVAYITFNIPIYPLFGLWYEGLQKRIKYYSSDNEKIILKPDQAKEIRFKYKGEDIRMLSCLDRIFLKLIVDGRLKLFYAYDRGNGRDEGNRSQYLLQKGDGELFNPESWGNKGLEIKMKDYWSDCPELAKKFDGRTYYYGGMFNIHSIGFSIVDIVKEYNNCK